MARYDVNAARAQRLEALGERWEFELDGEAFSLPTELEVLVECGLTPAEALRTATLSPAKFFGEEKTAGTVEAGKRADEIGPLNLEQLRYLRDREIG